MYSVYVLYENNVTRYIGISKCIEDRQYSHISGRYAKITTNKHYKHWYNKLSTPPEFQVICENLTQEQALMVESSLIINLKRVGCPLVNIAEYGNLAVDSTEKVKAAWKRGCYKTKKCLNHYKKMREDRMYPIICTEKSTNKSIVVHGLNEAVELTGAQKSNICKAIKKQYGYKSAKGWLFESIEN